MAQHFSLYANSPACYLLGYGRTNTCTTIARHDFRLDSRRGHARVLAGPGIFALRYALWRNIIRCVP